MARSIWTGAISFGLVTVPVKLYSAVNRKTVRFHQLNGKTGVRIAQKRVDPSTGDEVAYEDIVKGFELTPDSYVVIEPGELESLEPEEDQDHRDRGLRRALATSTRSSTTTRTTWRPAPAAPSRTACCSRRCARPARVAIARVVIRSKEQLVALRPMGDDVLGISTMLFADEVVEPDKIDELSAAAEVEATDRELDIAKQLVESLAGPFDPSKYHDTYREEVLGLIERKAAGEEIAVQPAAEEDDEPVPDLMAALKASLDAVREKDTEGNGDGAAKKAPAKKKAPAAKKKAAAKS